MRTPWMAPLALLALAGCDDTLYGSTEVVEGEGYDAVVSVFDGSCVSCHSDAAASSFGNLSLEGDPCDMVDAPASAYATDSNGDPAYLIVAGDSGASVLWHKVEDSGAFGGVMPPGAKMDQANIDIIANWIDQDAAGDCAAR
jgi:hypothetical protein